MTESNNAKTSATVQQNSAQQNSVQANQATSEEVPGEVSPQATVTKAQVAEVLKTIEDPELFIDIYFLGLIYSIDIHEDNSVDIEMTFTSPMCPAGPMLLDQVKSKVGAIEGVQAVDIIVVFSPPWQPSDEVKAMLGLI